MTRRDFQHIAAVIRGKRARVVGLASALTLVELSEEMADMLAETNPRFDRARFLVACGIAASAGCRP
jgi:hypothetical protein